MAHARRESGRRSDAPTKIVSANMLQLYTQAMTLAWVRQGLVRLSRCPPERSPSGSPGGRMAPDQAHRRAPHAHGVDSCGRRGGPPPATATARPGPAVGARPRAAGMFPARHVLALRPAVAPSVRW